MATSYLKYFLMSSLEGTWYFIWYLWPSFHLTKRLVKNWSNGSGQKVKGNLKIEHIIKMMGMITRNLSLYPWLWWERNEVNSIQFSPQILKSSFHQSCLLNVQIFINQLLANYVWKINFLWNVQFLITVHWEYINFILNGNLEMKL